MEIENEIDMSEILRACKGKESWKEAFSTSMIFWGKDRVLGWWHVQDIVENEHFKTRQCFEDRLWGASASGASGLVLSFL